MKKSRKPLALLVGSALVAGALFTGMASADSGKRPVSGTVQASATAQQGPAEEDPTSPDPDSIQEGDQTAPEKGEVEAPETGAESEKESDGPGGHEDPPGNVDHQFEGEE